MSFWGSALRYNVDYLKAGCMTAPAQGKIDRFKLKLNPADCGELGGFLLASHVEKVAIYVIVWL
jgi:hypothetical protein